MTCQLLSWVLHTTPERIGEPATVVINGLLGFSCSAGRMARRSTGTNPMNTTLQKGRRSNQRERLVAGMIAAASRDGYARANVSAVIESRSPKAPNRPRAIVATWAGKKLIVSWPIHSLDARMGMAGSRSRTILRMVAAISAVARSEEHTSELQSLRHLVC